MMGLLLGVLGCQELTPGEYVLGDEIEARIIQGQEGFGRSVAASGGRMAVSHPLRVGGTQSQLERVNLGFVRRVGFTEAGPWAWLTDDRVAYGPGFIEEESVPLATNVDRCPDGNFVSVTGPGEAISCSGMGVLRTRCSDARCSVHIDDGPALDEVSPGGAVAWMEQQACWGDPHLSVEAAKGRVACEDGSEFTGMSGDHLGLALAGQRAAGRYNRHIVPPRLRVVSITGGDVWLVDRAAENSRVSLAESGGSMVVGVPSFRQGATEGRVYVVAHED